MAYIGKSPETDSAVKKYEYTATSGQTTFSASYETRVDVYLNGVLLSETDYTATDGTSIVLDSGAATGDIVQIDAFQNISNARLNFTVDEDDMSSDSDTLVPTQQSVKAYVDTQVAAKDALSELSGTTDDLTEGSTNLFFTSAEQTKLSGIEASADVTDTANVTSAGALMDSEVTNLAQVKAFDSSDYATAAQGTLADSAVQDLSDLSITATATELNYVDGVTSNIQTQLDAKQATLTGLTSTVTELNYVDGVTSNVQTQLDTKAPLASPALTGTATAVNLTISGNLTVNGSTVTNSASNTTIEDALIELGSGNTGTNSNDLGLILERGTTGDNAFIGWDESADTFILGTTTATGASTGNLTVTAAPLSISALTLNSTAVTATADELNKLDGVTATTDEINYIDGVTSNIQTQLDAKQASSSVLTNTTASYTTAEETKLSGIETGADVTDTANVTSAGALMDSEVTNLAQVKAFDSTDYATAAQGTTADSALQNVSEDTTPQLGGNLDTNGKNISFGDSASPGNDDTLTFGASADLKIYHDGSNSFIRDTGTGNLYIKASTNLHLEDSSGYLFVTCIDGGNGGTVNLYHNNSKKLATSSTGVSVTGTVAATAYTGDGSALTGIDALPSQTGNNGYYLTTDGSSASWAALDTDANSTTKGLYEHANTISADYTISSGNNAMAAGPITVDSGYSVTVPSGSVWIIL